MPYTSLRLLENSEPTLLQNGNFRALELVPDTSEQVSQVWPKDWYAWTDRMGVTIPDVYGTLHLTDWEPTSTADAGTLIVTADTSVAGAVVGLALVLWDERGNEISISEGSITTSSWATNAAGYYIAANGFSVNPGNLAFNVSNAAGYTLLLIQISRGVVNLHSRLF